MPPITGETQLYGLIGWPVGHSLSPSMHNAAAVDLELDLVYVPLPVRPAELELAVRALPALGFQGVNVTVPHKQTVLDFLDELEPAAKAIGAVNTIVIDRRRPSIAPRLVGHNTDWTGFLADLKAYGVEVKGSTCLVLGAGGSGRAVAYGLASDGGHVHIVARRPEQAQSLVTDLGPSFPTSEISYHSWTELTVLSQGIVPGGLIVNTTPLGMTPHVDATPWPESLPFPKGSFVYDLVYHPAETRLLRQAAAAGRPTANGLGMLVHQGAQAFSLWTGREPRIEVMSAALKA